MLNLGIFLFIRGQKHDLASFGINIPFWEFEGIPIVEAIVDSLNGI